MSLSLGIQYDLMELINSSDYAALQAIITLPSGSSTKAIKIFMVGD